MLTIPLPRAHPPLAPSAAPDPVAETAKIDVTGLNFYYGGRRALEQITVQVRPNEVTALIGPSAGGKSTFLRTLNRMNDIVAGARVEGADTIDGREPDRPASAGVDLRRRLAVVAAH